MLTPIARSSSSVTNGADIVSSMASANCRMEASAPGQFREQDLHLAMQKAGAAVRCYLASSGKLADQKLVLLLSEEG